MTDIQKYCLQGKIAYAMSHMWSRWDPYTVKILDRNPHYFVRIFAYASTDMNLCRIRHVCLEAQIIAH